MTIFEMLVRWLRNLPPIAATRLDQRVDQLERDMEVQKARSALLRSQVEVIVRVRGEAALEPNSHS